jgi:hypothetical protein
VPSRAGSGFVNGNDIRTNRGFGRTLMSPVPRPGFERT